VLTDGGHQERARMKGFSSQHTDFQAALAGTPNTVASGVSFVTAWNPVPRHVPYFHTSKRPGGHAPFFGGGESAGGRRLAACLRLTRQECGLFCRFFNRPRAGTFPADAHAGHAEDSERKGGRERGREREREGGREGGMEGGGRERGGRERWMERE